MYAIVEFILKYCASEDRLLLFTYIITFIIHLHIKGFSQINPFWLTYYILHLEKQTERQMKPLS